MSVNDYKVQAAMSGKTTQEIVDVMFPGMSRNAETRQAYENMLRGSTAEQRHLEAVAAAEDYRMGRLAMSAGVPEATGPLWSVMAAEVLAGYDEVQLPLEDLAGEVHAEFMPGRPGQQAELKVYVDHGGHTTKKNATKFGDTSTGAAAAVSVMTNSYTTENEVSEVELRNYGSLKRRLGSMINNHMEYLVGEFGAAVKAVCPGCADGFVAATGELVGRLVPASGTVQGIGALTPEVLAEQVYPLFATGVDVLALSVPAYAKLLAKTRDDFGPVDGAWGMRKIRKVFPFPSVDVEGMGSFGFALKQNAVVWAACQPYVDEGMGLSHWEPLGLVHGVPLWLNVWYDHGSRVYKMSVNSQVGFTVANTKGCYVLSGPAA